MTVRRAPPPPFAFLCAKNVGETCLRALCDAGFVPAMVVTKEDGVTGGMRSLAKRHGFTLYVAKSWKDEHERVAAALREKGIRTVACAGFPHILSSTFLGQFDMAVNAHTGLLPEYRGFHPIAAALRNDEPLQGATLHYIVPAVDEGPIIWQESTAVRNEDTMNTLRARLNAISAALLVRWAKSSLATGVRLPARKQGKGTKIAPRYTEKDSRIRLRSSTARYVHNMVRCLEDPFPNAFTYDGKRRKIRFKASVASNAPGTVLARIAKRTYLVAATDGIVCVTTDRALRVGDRLQ